MAKPRYWTWATHTKSFTVISSRLGDKAFSEHSVPVHVSVGIVRDFSICLGKFRDCILIQATISFYFYIISNSIPTICSFGGTWAMTLGCAALSSVENNTRPQLMSQRTSLYIASTTGVPPLKKRGSAGGLEATSAPRPILNRPAKLFINLLLLTTSALVLFSLRN
jgi:hypothetical protein